MKNIANKERRLNKGDKPYAQWTDPRTGWSYALLKSWQGDNSKPYARWLVDVHGWGHDTGDTYVQELRSGVRLAFAQGSLTVDETVWPSPDAFVAWTYNKP